MQRYGISKPRLRAGADFGDRDIDMRLGAARDDEAAAHGKAFDAGGKDADHDAVMPHPGGSAQLKHGLERHA